MSIIHKYNYNECPFSQNSSDLVNMSNIDEARRAGKVLSRDTN